MCRVLIQLTKLHLNSGNLSAARSEAESAGQLAEAIGSEGLKRSVAQVIAQL